MSKINKDFNVDLQKLETRVKELAKQADNKIEEIQYGDWKQVAELEDFEISFRAGSLLSGSRAQVTFFYKLPKNTPPVERKRLIVFGEIGRAHV